MSLSVGRYMYMYIVFSELYSQVRIGNGTVRSSEHVPSACNRVVCTALDERKKKLFDRFTL